MGCVHSTDNYGSNNGTTTPTAKPFPSSSDGGTPQQEQPILKSVLPLEVAVSHTENATQLLLHSNN